MNVTPIRRLPDYLYLLICGDGETLYIKAGRSIYPLDRESQLQVACPFEVKEFGICEVSLQGAKQMERRMHKALEQFHLRGEWYRVQIGQREAFEAISMKVLERWIGPHAHWTMIDLESAKETGAYMRKKALNSLQNRRAIAKRNYEMNVARQAVYLEAEAKKRR